MAFFGLVLLAAATPERFVLALAGLEPAGALAEVLAFIFGEDELASSVSAAPAVLELGFRVDPFPAEPPAAFSPAALAGCGFTPAGRGMPVAGIPVFSGTEGRRAARISAARMEAWASSAVGWRSTTWVMISTSSRRLNRAAGLTRILRKISRPGETLFTVPMDRPLGK